MSYAIQTSNRFASFAPSSQAPKQPVKQSKSSVEPKVSKSDEKQKALDAKSMITPKQKKVRLTN